MKDVIACDKPTIAALAERFKRANSHSEYQRFQCILVRATLGTSAAEIAQLLGWTTAKVHVMHSRWSREGDPLFDVRNRGGQHDQHLSEQQEIELLAPFATKAQAGGMLHVNKIKQALEQW